MSTPSPTGMSVSKMKSTLWHNWLRWCVGKDKLGMGTFENTHKLLQSPSTLLAHSRLICTKAYCEKWCQLPTSPISLFIFSSDLNVSGNVERNYLPLISSAHIFHKGFFFFFAHHVWRHFPTENHYFLVMNKLSSCEFKLANCHIISELLHEESNYTAKPGKRKNSKSRRKHRYQVLNLWKKDKPLKHPQFTEIIWAGVFGSSWLLGSSSQSTQVGPINWGIAIAFNKAIAVLLVNLVVDMPAS